MTVLASKTRLLACQKAPSCASASWWFPWRWEQCQCSRADAEYASLASLHEDPDFDGLMRCVSQGRAAPEPTPTRHRNGAASPMTPESADVTFSPSASSEEGSVHTAHPSTVFLCASRQRGRHDDDNNDDKDDNSFDADPDHATASFESVNTSVSACGGCLTAISSNRTHA